MEGCTGEYASAGLYEKLKIELFQNNKKPLAFFYVYKYVLSERK
jgi:hypothetical protein